jgi:ubiquinol-cytochrome c reductase cytochrome c subunit
MGRSLKGRYLVPAALVGCVAVAGLVGFWSGNGQAAPAPTVATTTQLPPSVQTSYNPSSSGAEKAKAAAATKAEATLKAENLTPADEVGITYLSPVQNKSFLAHGEALFAANCSSCHGAQALGTGRAPNLQGLGAGTVDFWVSTGRMPLADSSQQATRKPPRFDTTQTLQIANWVQSLTPGVGVPIPVVHTSGADLEAGNELFTLNCAACHTITGAGDALMQGAYAPSLHLATPTQVVEAIRSGPGNMPHFGPGDITNNEARDITAYVTGVIQHPSNPGGVGLGGVGPVGEGFVGLLVGVGVLMLVCFWIGDRT